MPERAIRKGVIQILLAKYPLDGIHPSLGISIVTDENSTFSDGLRKPAARTGDDRNSTGLRLDRYAAKRFFPH